MQIDVNATPTLNYLASTVRQLPYAVANALNDTAKDVQAAIRREVTDRFILREPRWILQGIKIPEFVRKTADRFEIRVILSPDRGFLGIFQTGGQRTARGSFQTEFAVPSQNVRPSFSLKTPRQLLPKNLGLAPYQQITGGKQTRGKALLKGGQVVQIKGKQRTFLLTPESGVRVPGVYQRTGPGAVRLLFSYKSVIPIPGRPFFYDVGYAAAVKQWPIRFADNWQRALATAR